MPEERRIILAVDDDEMVLSLIELALQEGGFEVRTAANAEEAISALERGGAGEAVGLVTDVNLDGQTDSRGGWEVAVRARELNPRLIVVYISGDGHEWPARGVPGSAILEKPFAPTQLVTTVASLLAAPPTLPAAGRFAHVTSGSGDRRSDHRAGPDSSVPDRSS